MEDLKELRKQGIYQERCLLCRTLTPQVNSTEELAFWMAINNWNAFNITESDYIIYCPDCKVQFITHATYDCRSYVDVDN